jgi:hypothetical protein
MIIYEVASTYKLELGKHILLIIETTEANVWMSQE